MQDLQNLQNLVRADFVSIPSELKFHGVCRKKSSRSRVLFMWHSEEVLRVFTCSCPKPSGPGLREEGNGTDEKRLSFICIHPVKSAWHFWSKSNRKIIFKCPVEQLALLLPITQYS